ncbi:MAG: dihydrofolate reductase family protein [Oscillospiraceae bacterium]|nr:dihydrofolate reductase family protein [Oscillospiraceae bacterium]
MGKLCLCIAASLDGYIADDKGSVDFLFEKPRIDPDPEYLRFYAEVESILFGSVSYRQITQEISPGRPFFPDKKCYVFTAGASLKDGGKNVSFTSLPPAEFVKEAAAGSQGLIWLFGGRRLIRSFMEADLIDQYWIYTMPVILGAGVPLFSPGGKRLELLLSSVSRADNIVKTFYDRVR